MQIIDSASELRTTLDQHRKTGRRIGFVPTMGNLHDGHLALVKQAKAQCDLVVTSVYVNPTQFGPNEDFDTYPRTLEADRARLASVKNDILFTPPTQTLYPNGRPPKVTIDLPDFSHILCGASRPTFFGGVAIVVTKLFNLVQPDRAFFGEKDFQQLLIVKQLVKELLLPIEVIGVPIVREENGLAMSSRNQYLSDEEKARAGELYLTLTKTADLLRSGKLPLTQEALQAHTTQSLNALAEKGFSPDYFTICNPSNLSPPQKEDKALVLLIAAALGQARLIDNLSVNL